MEDVLADKRYEDMEFAWISSAGRWYPSFVNVELEKKKFKEWFYSECGQKYVKNVNKYNGTLLT